jgi:hypothetical protein
VRKNFLIHCLFPGRSQFFPGAAKTHGAAVSNFQRDASATQAGHKRDKDLLVIDNFNDS